jgi:spore coat polysaccharide biosynthesis protein SpsF (cytidylyltransferase family)
MPLGMGVELVRLSSLRKAASQSVIHTIMNMCVPYLYRNPDCSGWNSGLPFRLRPCPEARLTVDTARITG